MEKKALAELAEVAEENVGNHPWAVVSSPWSVGLCAVTAGKVVRLEQARALIKMMCASRQNDVRDQAK